MAFLCPSRRGRQKKKHKESKAPFHGRITGSASIDTLVRVGLEKQHGLAPDSRMRVTQDFLATRKDELGAQQGDILYKLYQDGDWAYVITQTGQEGFIPTICVTPLLHDNKSAPGSHSKRQGHSKAATTNGSAFGANESRSAHNGSPVDGTKLTVSSNQNSRRRSTGSHDASTQAETGSDVSSSSLSQSVGISPDAINPLPKPLRTHNNIPDIVSTTKSSSQRPSSDSHPSDVSAFKTSLPVKENGGDVTKKNKSLRHSRHSVTDKTGSDNLDGKATLSPNLTTAGARLSHASGGDSITEVRTFVKRVGPKFVVVFSFEAKDENDVTVERGEVVTVLNDRDQHWTWVKKRNGQEGFVPCPYMCSIPENLLPNSGPAVGKSETRPKSVTSPPAQYHDVRELYTVRHFTAQSADDISVQAGEQVFADLANQIERDWLWVYAPANQCYGYIPKDNVSTSPRMPAASQIRDADHKQPSYL